MSAGDNGETLRGLVVRLIDHAKEYLRAEIMLARQTAVEWGGRAKLLLILIGVAIFLVQAALTVLLASLGLALAQWLGLAGGMAVAALAGLGLAGLLGWLAVSRLTGKNT